MRQLLILALLVGVAVGQGGFFSNFFGRPRRPPPPRNPQAFRPGPPQQQPQPQPQFNNARPPPGPPQQRPQQQFRQPPPQQQAFSRPVQPQPGPSTVQLRNVGGSVNNANSVVPSGKFTCPLRSANHFDKNGRGYIVTFFDKSDDCNKFTGEEAEEFCQEVGGHAVSLDSNEKALEIMDLLRQKGQRYMWTGGRIDHTRGAVTWKSGNQEGWVRGQRFWSHTGG